ncbi:MAG: hypothetical protein WBB47_07905 [Paenisporosarcina sp.]|jgi:hypothetical protein|uniref:hypothetical protein n=1 Tax=Paenisporosarcina sp. TaxID=1932001 RepID=UPI003C789FF8
MESIGLFIVLSIISLLVLFIVIESAVTRGINNSIVGQYLEKKNGVKENKKFFIDDDLDN